MRPDPALSCHFSINEVSDGECAVLLLGLEGSVGDPALEQHLSLEVGLDEGEDGAALDLAQEEGGLHGGDGAVEQAAHAHARLGGAERG